MASMPLYNQPDLRNQQSAKADASQKRLIYFVQAGVGGPIKIGITSDLENRLAGLKTSCPYPLSVIGTVQGTRSDERLLHLCLTCSRMTGEWFEPTPKVLALIKDAMAGIWPEPPAPVEQPRVVEPQWEPAEFTAAARALGVNLKALGAELGVSTSTAYRYANGEMVIPRTVALAVECLLRRRGIVGE